MPFPPGCRAFLGGLVATLILGGSATALLADGELIISQKNRQFQPGSVTIGKGRPLVIVNDDGTVVHHAYVESPVFDFDSGDQTPGGRATIVFPVAGDFKVLCGIHPRMKLDVHVQ